MKTIGLVLSMMVLVGLGFAQYGFADNTSISKQRPQAEEIKYQVSLKAKAIIEKRIAELRLQQQEEKNRQEIQDNMQKEMSLSEKIKMQYKMPDKAKQQKEQLVKVMTENYKKTLQTKKTIEKLINEGKVKLHEKTKMEYGRTK
jgi:hypothetical protein